MKLSNYYFTFGTDERYAYRGGWVQIEAESMNRAMEIFQQRFPGQTPEMLNCAGYYTEAQFERTDMARNGNLGAGCQMKLYQYGEEIKKDD